MNLFCKLYAVVEC